jgi:hypothetical protein
MLQYIPIFILKDGDTYTGISLALPGVSVTTKTFEEAQIAVMNVIDSKIIEMTERHRQNNNYKPISRRPLEETISCVYKSSQREEDDECCNSAKKDGLCLVHWKKLYGHPYGATLKTCPLCKENDQNILADNASPCSFKLENPGWETILEEIKFKRGQELAKERRKVRIERFGS